MGLRVLLPRMSKKASSVTMGDEEPLLKGLHRQLLLPSHGFHHHEWSFGESTQNAVYTSRLFF